MIVLEEIGNLLEDSFGLDALSQGSIVELSCSLIPVISAVFGLIFLCYLIKAGDLQYETRLEYIIDFVMTIFVTLGLGLLLCIIASLITCGKEIVERLNCF